MGASQPRVGQLSKEQARYAPRGGGGGRTTLDCRSHDIIYIAGNHSACPFHPTATQMRVTHVNIGTANTAVGDLDIDIIIVLLLEFKVDDLEVGPVLGVVDTVSFGRHDW